MESFLAYSGMVKHSWLECLFVPLCSIYLLGLHPSAYVGEFRAIYLLRLLLFLFPADREGQVSVHFQCNLHSSKLWSVFKEPHTEVLAKPTPTVWFLDAKGWAGCDYEAGVQQLKEQVGESRSRSKWISHLLDNQAKMKNTAAVILVNLISLFHSSRFIKLTWHYDGVHLILFLTDYVVVLMASDSYIISIHGLKCHWLLASRYSLSC